MSCECSPVLGAGLGTGGLGTMPLGTGTADADALALRGSELIAANFLAVFYSGDPGLPNPGDTSGPLWPDNWHLIPLDPELVVRLVQLVIQVPDEATRAQFTDDWPQIALLELPFFLVWFDGNPTPGGRYELQLLLEDGLVPGCDCTELVGLTLRRDAVQTDARDGDRLEDVANPLVARDVLQLPPLLGTYQLTDTGDFGLDKSPEASLRKRLLRRVTTAAGGFFHLPGYGAAPKLKGLLTVDAVERLQTRIRAQCLQEPDVVTVQVSLALAAGSTGTLMCTIKATPNGGDPVGLVVPIQIP